MSLLHKIAVVVVALLLTTTVASANAVVATHRTALNPDFVTGTLEEENGYRLMDDAVQQAVTSSLGEQGGGELGSNELLAGIIDRAVTREYVRTQVNGIVTRLYAFLHGNSQELNLTVQTDPVVENVPAAVENEMKNASLSTLFEATGSESLGQDTSLGSTDLDASDLARMDQNESSYREVRADLRETIREQAISAAVNRTFQESTNDELLALVIEDYDPDAYSESEKEQMVEDRESEIKTVLRRQVRSRQSDEINETIDQRLQSLAGNTTTVENPENVSEATQNLQAVLLQGLAGDMSYSTFDRELTAAKGDVGRQVGEQLQGNLEEQIPPTISLTENMDQQAMQQLDQAQRIVGILDILGIALPLLVLALIGLLWWLTRSAASVATSVGSSLFFAGIPAWLGAEWAASRARTFVQENGASMPDAAKELTLGFVDATTGTIAAQSLAIGLVGALVFAIGTAIKYGYIDVDELMNRSETTEEIGEE